MTAKPEPTSEGLLWLLRVLCRAGLLLVRVPIFGRSLLDGRLWVSRWGYVDRRAVE